MTDPQLDQPPAVPPKVRTIAYFSLLGWSGFAATATGIVAAVAPASGVLVGAICGAVTAGLGIVAGGLGVVYRPTAQR